MLSTDFNSLKITIDKKNKIFNINNENDFYFEVDTTNKIYFKIGEKLFLNNSIGEK